MTQKQRIQFDLYLPSNQFLSFKNIEKYKKEGGLWLTK